MISNQYPSIAERRRLGIYTPHLEVDLTERFGEDVARLILERFGGSWIALPDKPHANHPIAQIVPVDVLAWLIATYGRGDLEVPLGPNAPRIALAVRVRRLVAETELPIGDISRLTRYHARSVRRVIQNMRAAGISLPHRPDHPQTPRSQTKEKIAK